LINYLGNIFLNKKISLYPAILLPKLNYHLIDISVLNKVSGILLIRRSEKDSLEETFDELGNVRTDALTKGGSGSKFKHYSINLIGGGFIITHLNLRQIEEGQQNWVEGASVEDYLNKFITLPNPSIPIYFLLQDLHNVPIPYTTTDKEEIEKYRELFEAFNEEPLKQVEVKGTCTIKHVPTNLNFWHVQLETEDSIGKPAKLTTPKEDNESKRHSISRYLIEDVIKASAKPNYNPPIIEIPENLYISVSN